MEVKGFDYRNTINMLLKSHHGDFNAYIDTAYKAADADPEFFHHMITWNLAKGEVRDSKVALPTIALRFLGSDDDDFAENALANLVSLDPRNLVRAYRFNKELSASGKNIPNGYRRNLEAALKKYIQVREDNIGWWNATVLQHRKSMKELYAVSHIKPSEYAQSILFDREPPKNTVFERIGKLKDMSAAEAAGTILQYKIPFQIAIGALGRKKEEYEQNPEFILALLNNMSGQQILANTNMLEKFGVFRSPVLSAAYNAALTKSKSDKKVSTLKASKAIDVLSENSFVPKEVIEKISQVQEAKIAQKTIDGDWVILGDKSGSMESAISTACEIAAYIAKSVAGKVHLIFFDTMPRYYDVTGKTLAQIKEETRRISASGGTSCGCGLEYLRSKSISIDGIVLVSDGGDNAQPYFHDAYKKYSASLKEEPVVYYFDMNGEPDKVSRLCDQSGININKFDLRKKVDHYSIPNLVSTMSTKNYGIYDQIMSTPLLKLSDIFK